MSFLYGPRTLGGQDGWHEQVAQAMEDAHRRGLVADASWQAWVAQNYSEVWVIYLGSPVMVVILSIVLTIASLFATNGTRNPQDASMVGVIVVDLIAIIGACLIGTTILRAMWRINWIGRCITVIYLYVIASWTLGGSHNVPSFRWIACFVACLASEYVAKRWRANHIWDD